MMPLRCPIDDEDDHYDDDDVEMNVKKRESCHLFVSSLVLSCNSFLFFLLFNATRMSMNYPL